MYQLNGAWFELSDHATERAIDMALLPEQVQGVLGDPRHTRPGLAGRELWTRDKVTAVVEARDGYWSVVTFMWATAHAWVVDQESVRSRSHGLSPDRMRAQRYATKMRKRGRSVR